jgi:uncharacterized membrane protein YphA (DoxX/SURF4 family)
MTVKSSRMVFGWRVYGAGVMALGLLGLALGDFVNGQPVAKGFPDRMVLAYAAGALMLVGGAAVEWRRSTAWGAAILTAYYTVVVIILMHGRPVVANYAVYGVYEDLAEQVGIAAAGLIVYAGSAKIAAALAARLALIGRVVFGLCALVWGGAHFKYMNMTAPLVPKWLPPSQVFWGYTTGVCFVAAGVAILTGVKARLAAILLTGMLASFTFLVHVRMLLADHSGVFNWSELALNITLVGVAWVVADSLAAVPSWSDSNGR